MKTCPSCGHANADESIFCEECSQRLDGATDPFVDTIVDGRYQVVRKIAEGGMGVVYFAKNVRLDVDAALKVLHPDLARNKKFLSRFENEAKTVVRLRHQNIVQVFDTGPIRDTYYIAMEFIQGEDLVDIIEKRGKLPLEEAFYIAVQAAQGLAYAHERGILHRDIKPANIIIEPSGRTVITDFGIARSAKAKSDTTIGSVVGTPEYMSLEQLKGMDIDARADIYSLGVVLYEMLTGVSPFRAEESVSAIAKVLSETAPPIEELRPDLPEWAVAIVKKAMAKERKERFGSAEELIAQISHHMADSSFIIPKVSLTRKTRSTRLTSLVNELTANVRRLPRRQQMLTAALASLIVVGVIVTGVLLVKSLNFSLRSLFSSGTAPLGTSREADRVWGFKTFGPIDASPLVSGTTVYVGSGDGTLYAVTTGKGNQLWVFKAEDAINTTPAAWWKTVYFGSDDHSLYAVANRNGELVWRFTTGGDVRSSPELTDRLVIFGSNDDILYAVDKSSGEEVWRFKTKGKIVSSPAAWGNLVYFGSFDNRFYALDITSGKEAWRFETNGDIESSPVVTRSLVLFGSDDDYLYALDRTTGKEVWRFETDGDVVGRPAVNWDTVYVGSRDGSVYAVDLQTGKLKWRHKTGGDICSSPALTERSVLIGSDDGNAYALSLTDGSERWRAKTGGKVRSGPAVSDGTAYFGSRDGYLYAVR